MLLINCKIHTLEKEGIIESGFIQIRGNLIEKIGAMSQLSDICSEARDLRGAEVYPGFIDAHTHLGMWEDSMGFEGDDGNEDTDPSTPHLRAIDAVNPVDRCFEEALSAGITSVLTGPGSANPIAGQFAAISTNGKRIDDMILREPVAVKFALGENPKNTYHPKAQAPVTRMATAAIIREQLIKAQRYLDDIQLFEENREDYDRPEFDFKCEALLPLLKREIKAHFHAHRADDIFTAMRIAKEFNLDYVIVHGTNGHKFADVLAKENVPVLCGPIICDRCKPELSELSAEGVGILAGAGVKTAIITDHPETPLNYLPLCASIACQNGLSHDDAIKSITINPAEICGIDNLVGSIKSGKRADIVIFDKGTDPLTLGARPIEVISGGKTAFAKGCAIND